MNQGETLFSEGTMLTYPHSFCFMFELEMKMEISES